MPAPGAVPFSGCPGINRVPVLFVWKKWMDSPGRPRPSRDCLTRRIGIGSQTALAGLFVAGSGYDPEALFWHNGRGPEYRCFCWHYAAWRKRTRQHRSWSVTVATTAALAIVFTGPPGATITHGRDFLWAPLLGDKDERAPMGRSPGLSHPSCGRSRQSKCMSCHNRSKAKGKW